MCRWTSRKLLDRILNLSDALVHAASIRSETLQMVFATPPAIAGVSLRVFCILTKLLDETVRRIRGSVEMTLTSIARFHRLSRAALSTRDEIDADDWVVRFRYRPFPTQKLGRCFGQPD